MRPVQTRQKHRVAIVARKRGFSVAEIRALFKALKMPPTLAEKQEIREVSYGGPGYRLFTYRNTSDYREITQERANHVVAYLVAFFPVVKPAKVKA